MLCVALGYLSCSGWSRQGAAGRERIYKLSLCSQVRMGLILSSGPDLTIIPVFASQHTSRRRCRAGALSCRNFSEAVGRAPAQVGSSAPFLSVHEETPQAWFFSSTSQLCASAMARLHQKGRWESGAVGLSRLEPVVETALHLVT